MFCNKCGRTLIEGSSFCDKCGARVGGAMPLMYPQPGFIAPQPMQSIVQPQPYVKPQFAPVYNQPAPLDTTEEEENIKYLTPRKKLYLGISLGTVAVSLALLVIFSALLSHTVRSYFWTVIFHGAEDLATGSNNTKKDVDEIVAQIRRLSWMPIVSFCFGLAFSVAMSFFIQTGKKIKRMQQAIIMKKQQPLAYRSRKYAADGLVITFMSLGIFIAFLIWNIIIFFWVF